MAYAKDTSVSVSKTEAEIKGIIRRYGASSFASFETGLAAMIAFEMSGRRIVFKLPLPDREDKALARTPTGKPRVAAQVMAAWEQACRSRWRAVFLCIKAKLESVEAGIETFESAFLAHIQLPGGALVGEEVIPRIAEWYQSKEMQTLLPAPH